MLALTFEIRMKSNYHIGAGYGKGFSLDSALLREADGAPVLRGSGLSGLLCDGAYRLLRLPLLAKHPTDEVLERLFGTPAQAKHWRFASAHPVDRRLKDSQAVQRVRIDPRTRRAEEHKLFSQEEGVAGQVFRFTATCPKSDASAMDEAALLVAAARNVRQLGRSRRRGLGECTIQLYDVSGVDEAKSSADQTWEEWFLSRFDQVWLRGSPTPISSSEIKSDIRAVNTPTGGAVRVRVIVRLDEPLIVSQRALAGNRFDTRSYISGIVLLGTLAGLAATNCNLADEKIYNDFVALFLRGGLAFPMLYPAYQYQNNLYPTIPAPLGLLTCSVVPFRGMSEGHGTSPAGVPYVDNRNKCPRQGCTGRLEPVSDFVILKGDVATYLPQRSSEMHIRTNQETQRANRGDLYGYTVVSAGEYFVGELLCADEGSWEALQEMTGIAEKVAVRLFLGKARQRGYGQVTAWLERYDTRPQTWIQQALGQRVTAPTELLTLTLLTDTIMADPWGGQATGFAADWLETTLRLGPVEIVDAYARTRVVDGFKATLGLPRWRDLALMAGAVAWVRLLDPPPNWSERMQELETEGIGLRRNEGFGRVVFNHPVYDQRHDLSNSAIRLDRQIRLCGEPVGDTFLEQWEERLDKSLVSVVSSDTRYVALARWLYANSDQPPQEIQKQLIAIGQPTRELIEAVGGLQEYGQRRKPSCFQQKELEAISNLLGHLQQREDSQHWRSGIERLAEWIAVAARKEGGAS